MNMTDEIGLVTVEAATRKFSDARGRLADQVETLTSQIEALKKVAMPGIKKAVAVAGERYSELRALVEAAPFLFEKPRTVVFHGVKVGFQKGKGGIDWDDDARVVELIEKHFTKPQAELLIKTSRKPIARAIQDLDVAELRKIGCRVEETGDVVVIRPVDGEVDKIVNALLKDATESEG